MQTRTELLELQSVLYEYLHSADIISEAHSKSLSDLTKRAFLVTWDLTSGGRSAFLKATLTDICAIYRKSQFQCFRIYSK